MKTKLMLAALLASAALAQAGPTMTPAKSKAPLHLSQVKSIFRRSEPSAPVQQASTGAPIASPVSKKVHVKTFLNHPVTAPGPK
jgi:anti-sigma factor RsiW